MRYLKFLAAAMVLLSVACQNNNDDDDDNNQNINESTTVIVLNEGAFGSGNASATTYDLESGDLHNDVFFTKNGRALGDVAQSVYSYQGKTYFSLNVSNKVEVVKTEDLSELGTIDITLPRYMEAKDNKLYVSSWDADGEVVVVNADNLQVEKKIEVGTGPEQMLLNGDKLYVANGGGFTEDSTLSIIDLNSGTVASTLHVGDIPMDLVEDAAGHIWVLCKGKTIYDQSYQVIGHTESKLVEIDPATDQIINTITLFTDQHPSHLEINGAGTMVYLGAGYGFSGIYSMSLTGSGLVPNKLIDKDAYGFNVNPENDDVFVLEAPDFLNAGNLIIFSKDGLLKESHVVGVGPNSALFPN